MVIFIQTFGLLVFFGLIAFAWSMIITDFFGPPIVPTPKKIILEIFNEVKPKKDDFFIDLGSGSGRVVRMITDKYGIQGLGIEINPFLILWSRFRILFGKQKNVHFRRQNYLKADLSKANIIYMYLLPKNIPGVAEKIEKECRKGVVVISQRFAVNGWRDLLVKEMLRKNNSSYIYRL